MDLMTALETIDGAELTNKATGHVIVIEAHRGGLGYHGDVHVHIYEHADTNEHVTLVLDATEVRPGHDPFEDMTGGDCA